jgi:hypothetical protein
MMPRACSALADCAMMERGQGIEHLRACYSGEDDDRSTPYAGSAASSVGEQCDQNEGGECAGKRAG